MPSRRRPLKICARESDRTSSDIRARKPTTGGGGDSDSDTDSEVILSEPGAYPVPVGEWEGLPTGMARNPK
eukprot:2159134-Rhodomonas_salina.2